MGKAAAATPAGPPAEPEPGLLGLRQNPWELARLPPLVNHSGPGRLGYLVFQWTWVDDPR